MRPAYLSASQLTCFLACPAKYRYRYIDRREPATRSSNLALGSAVHSSLEWLHKQWHAGSQPSKDAVLTIFEADLTAQVSVGLQFRPNEDRSSLLELGMQLLQLYLAQVPATIPHAVEMPFEVALMHPESGETLDTPLRGWIDLIETDGTVVELKTAARAFDAESLALHPQLSAYSYASTRIYRERRPLRLDCLIKTRQPKFERVSVARSRTDDARLFHIAREVVGAIEAGAFFPNPSWQCRSCEYQYACPVWET